MIKPPAPLLPLPMVTLIAPALPPVEAADPIETEPVVPDVDVPELNASKPDTPASPALEDAIVIAPLVLAMPCPLATPTVPPVRTVLWPDCTRISPPVPLLPLPTLMLRAPDLPPVDAPVPIEIDPDVDVLDVPELNASMPLAPAVPAFAERILTTPLLVGIP